MQSQAVGRGKNCNGFYAKLAAGANDAHRNLAPIGDEDFFEHERWAGG